MNGSEEIDREEPTSHTGADVRKLREADLSSAKGVELPEVTKGLEVSEATYHRWRAQYGGMKADDAKRLKELERETSG